MLPALQPVKEVLASTCVLKLYFYYFSIGNTHGSCLVLVVLSRSDLTTFEGLLVAGPLDLDH